MQPEELKQAIQKIKMWQRGGDRAPHKPLLLLYALGRLARGEPRQMNYKEVKDDLKSLLDEFGPPRNNHSPSYPFVRLCNDRLPQSETAIWQIEGRENLNTKEDWSDRDLIDNVTIGGFTEPVYKLLQGNQGLINEIATTILQNNFSDSLHKYLLSKVGLEIGSKVSEVTVGGFNMSITPQCPKCGSEMVMRTARRGENAGGQFYGCSNYPHCKGTVSMDGVKTGREENLPLNKESMIFSLPHNMNARSKYKNYQSCFIESVATTHDILEIISDSTLKGNEIKAFTQWRVDFPLLESTHTFNERSNQVLSVCEKLLTRGRLTICSPYVETKLKNMFSRKDISNDDIVFNIFMRKQLIPEKLWFDSKAEEIFYYDILPLVFEDDFVQWVTPQVAIAGLIPNIEGLNLSGRVDFLINHPSIEKPVIVEIQGTQHRETQEIDRDRNSLLEQNGYIVEEFEAKDVELAPDSIVEKLKIITKDCHRAEDKYESNYVKLIQASKIIHQIQITIIQAIKYGFLAIMDNETWGIKVTFQPTNGLSFEEFESICTLALEDLVELLNQISSLYSLPAIVSFPLLSINNEIDLHEVEAIAISFNSNESSSLNTFYIQDVCLPFHVANLIITTNAAILDDPEEGNLLYFLKYLFRKETFMEGQLDTILRAFNCKDAIVLLPTGGGKSIAFQLASLLLPGRTIVIEPIISLIEDQVDNLASYGIDRCISITSLIVDPDERSTVLNLFSQGEYLMLYIAPERLQMTGFREALRSLTTHSPINIVVIDEAHCVSEWGHDFRTSYLNIGRISRDYCESQGIVPPLIALTGTASRAVLKDVQRELQIEDFDAIITPKSFDRKELKFSIIPCKSAEKFPRLKGFLSGSLPGMFNVTKGTLTQTNGNNTFSGLVFCPWVNGEFGVVQISKKIYDELSIPNDYYSGKAPKYQGNRYGWNLRKQYVTKSFKKNKVPLLTCTKAFGMGIDKPNIRYTIHYGLPSSIEAFYQEAGRAGRDRKIAHCTILASLDDKERAQKILNPNTTVEEIADIIDATPRVDNDDITRSLFFHAQAFRGVEAELNQIKKILNSGFNDYKTRGFETVCYEKDDKSIEEKCLHRLLLLGIINDYTVDYSNNAFTVSKTGASKDDIINSYEKYIASYLGSRSSKEVEKAYALLTLDHDGFVVGMLQLLLTFIYSVIEKGRRRALYEMYLTAADKSNDSSIRERILRYLEATEHSLLIEELLEEPDAGIEKVISIIDEIRSPNDAAEIRGQASRYLESYPDFPSILMLRAITEIYTKDRDPEVVKQNFLASIKSALQNYKIEDSKLYLFLASALILIDKQNNLLASELLELQLEEFNSVAFSKIMVKALPEGLASSPALHVVANLNSKCMQLISN